MSYSVEIKLSCESSIKKYCNKNSPNVPHPALKGGALRGTFINGEFLEHENQRFSVQEILADSFEQEIAHSSAGL